MYFFFQEVFLEKFPHLPDYSFLLILLKEKLFSLNKTSSLPPRYTLLLLSITYLYSLCTLTLFLMTAHLYLAAVVGSTWTDFHIFNLRPQSPKKNSKQLL